MSDTDVDTSLDPSSFILREQRSSMAHAMSSLADDPEKAARSIELGDATGDNPTLIYPNLENYEEQHKAALTASLLTSNKYLRQYVDADPMHAKISNDDYGNLDSVSEQLKKLSLPMRILRLPEAGGSIFSGAWEGFKKGFGDSPSGSWLTDKDIKEHRLGSAVAATLAMPVEGVLRFGSGILEGAKEGVKEGAKAGYQQLTGDEQGAEQFSRDLASMVEQYMMGTSGVHAPHVPDVKFSDAAIKIRPIIEKASPWLDESREPPRGLDPEIDKLKFEQNKIDLGNLDEALKAAQGSATRERSPEIFASFIRQHSDASIGISGDAVAKLYGSKVPEAGDNILGWSPRIAEELRTAVATGGDVQVPLADWLAKVDPEVAKELHDDIRVRPGGITKNEKVAEAEAKEGLAEPPKPAEIIPEPLPSVRGASGLEPMFSQGDRKLELKRMVGRGGERAYETPGTTFHDFDLLDENGDRRGYVNLSYNEAKKQLYVEMIQGGGTSKMYDPNFFGPSLVRDLFRQIKAEFPEAESITGHRVSGAREKAKSWEGPSASPVIKFDELEGPRGWTQAEALHNLFNPTMVDVGKGGILHYSPEFAPHEAQADKIIRDTLAKIAPDAQVFTPSHIEVPDKPFAMRGGFMQPFYEQNPWIIVALDAGDTLGVARHEAVHYLKQFGFFKEGEWDTLSRAAREQDWVKKFGIDRRYPTLDMSAKLEESIAEGYRNWLRGEEVSPRLHPIFERLKELFESLKSQLKELLGREPTWEELFQKMDTGEVGAREPRGHAGGAFLEPSAMDEQAAPKAANDIDALQRKHAPTYEAAVKNQTIERYVNKDTERGDTQYWRKIAADEGHNVFDRPNSIAAARAHSRDGKTTMVIAGDGSRTVFHDGVKVVREGRGFEPSMMEGEEPMFDKAAAVGMTADQFKRYMKLIDQRHTEDLAAATARAEKEQGKRLTKEWKDNEKQVRQDVSDSIRQRPDVAADLFFGAGELYGNKISSRVKIGEEFITPEQRAKLPKDYVSKSGVNPDDFAGVFGYGSGAAMVDRLGEYNEAKMQAGMSAKNYVKRVTDLETQRQMEIKYGSLEKSILDEAKDQAISETQLDLLHEEVLALGIKAGGKFSITKDQLKSWVKGEFEQTPLRSIDTDKFLASAGKAGKAAEMSLLKEDYAGAFRAKQQQYLAMQMAIEAKKLEKSMPSFDKLAKRLSARDQPSLDPSYIPYIHQILFQIGRQVKRSVQDLQSALAYQGKTLEEFVDFKQQHDLREIPVAEFLLDPAFKKEFENLTVEEFRAVHDSIKALNANARDELKIYKAGEAADLADIKTQMIDQLRTFKEKFYDAKGGRWMLGAIPPKVASIIRTYGAAHLQMEALFNRWDRGDPRGVFSQYVMRDLAAAANSEAALEKKYSRVLKDIPSPKDLKKQVDNPIFKDPVSLAGGAEGYLMSFTRENMLAILLDAGNESNLVKRAKGYGLHRAQVTDWLNTHATKEDWDWAQKIWDTFSEIKKESDVMYRSISGVEPEAIDIKPIQTPHGEYAGGYYPIIFHPEFEGTFMM